MEGLTLPYAERSGEHRIVHTDAGSLREIVAALRVLSSLARSRGVSSIALGGALDELETSLRAAQGGVRAALLPSTEVLALSTGMHAESERAATEILSSSARALGDVDETIDRLRAGRIKASARLELERRCDAAASTLESVTTAIETLQKASVARPIPLAFGDLLPGDEPEVAPDSRRGAAPSLVRVHAPSALDALVVVPAAVGTALVRDLIEEVAATDPRGHVSLVVTREERTLRVSIERGGDGKETHRWQRRERGSFATDVARLVAAAAALTVTSTDRGLILALPCP